MGLSDTELVSALGNAGTQSSGLWQCRHEQVATKHFHVARACQSGYVAAELASLGFAGPRFILEGPQGLFAATAPDADPTALVAQADGPWRLMGTSVKPWPACRHTHPAIDAALALRPAIAGREIEGVIISGTRDAAAFCDRTHPTTPGEARFSLQHAVAATLIHGAPELWAFEPPAIAQADIATLRARSVVLVGEEYEARYPARFGGGVVVRLRDGGELEASIPDALGDPENPLPEERLVGKAATLLAEAGFGSARIDAVVANARALADDRPVEGLIASLAEGWPVRLAS